MLEKPNVAVLIVLRQFLESFAYKRNQQKLELQQSAPAAPVNSTLRRIAFHCSTLTPMRLTCTIETLTLRRHISMLRQKWLSHTHPVTGEPDAPAGVCYLPDLSVLRFEGNDAATFLQGYVTCDTQKLSPKRLQPAAVCNLQGRVVFNGWCVRADDAEKGPVDLIVHRSLAPRVASFLEAYLRFSRTSLADMGEDILVFGYLANDPPPGALRISEDIGLLLADDLEKAEKIWHDLPHAPTEVWQAHRLAEGWPLISTPTSESFLPQMLDLDRLGAISFDKGCYLGQEIVARAQHRGKVKRRLARLNWTGPEAPAAGTEVTHADDASRACGTLVEAARLSEHGGIAIAVIAEAAPDELRVGECRLSARG
jgi:folate-binding protein YgfZ